MNIDIIEHQKNLNKLLFISDEEIEKLSISLHNFFKNIRSDLINGCAICGKLEEITEHKCECTKIIYEDDSYRIYKNFSVNVKKSDKPSDTLSFHIDISLSFYMKKDMKIFPYHIIPHSPTYEERDSFAREFFARPVFLCFNKPEKLSKPPTFIMTYSEEKQELSFIALFRTINDKSILREIIILDKNCEYHKHMDESKLKLNNLILKTLFPYLNECFNVLKNLIKEKE